MPYTVKEPYLRAAQNTTIEQMIKWMEKLETKRYYVYDPEYHAIRILLDEHHLRTATDKTQVTVWGHTLDELGEIVRQHHDRSEAPGNTYEVAIIKSFVERVGAKYTVEHPTVVVPEFMQPWWDAIDELEKERDRVCNTTDIS